MMTVTVVNQTFVNTYKQYKADDKSFCNLQMNEFTSFSRKDFSRLISREFKTFFNNDINRAELFTNKWRLMSSTNENNFTTRTN